MWGGGWGRSCGAGWQRVPDPAGGLPAARFVEGGTKRSAPPALAQDSRARQALLQAVGLALGGAVGVGLLQSGAHYRSGPLTAVCSFRF